MRIILKQVVHKSSGALMWHNYTSTYISGHKAEEPAWMFHSSGKKHPEQNDPTETLYLKPDS